MNHNEDDQLDLHYYHIRHRENRIDDTVISNYVDTIIDIIKGRQNIKEQLHDLCWMLVDDAYDECEDNLLFEDIYTKINLLNAKHNVIE